MEVVVEVVSPGSAVYDRNTKADTYGALGVRELWLCDEQAGTVEVRRREGAGLGASAVFSQGDRTILSILPGLDFTAAQIFAD